MLVEVVEQNETAWNPYGSATYHKSDDSSSSSDVDPANVSGPSTSNSRHIALRMPSRALMRASSRRFASSLMDDTGDDNESQNSDAKLPAVPRVLLDLSRHCVSRENSKPSLMDSRIAAKVNAMNRSDSKESLGGLGGGLAEAKRVLDLSQHHTMQRLCLQQLSQKETTRALCLESISRDGNEDDYMRKKQMIDSNLSTDGSKESPRRATVAGAVMIDNKRHLISGRSNSKRFLENARADSKRILELCRSDSKRVLDYPRGVPPPRQGAMEGYRRDSERQVDFGDSCRSFMSELTSTTSDMAQERDRHQQQQQQQQHYCNGGMNGNFHGRPGEASSAHRDQECPPSQEPHMVEIFPGVFESLRGAAETWKAIELDYFMPIECVTCSSDIFCIQDSRYVLCPNCRCVGPMQNDAEAIGVGLGFTYEQLSSWQGDILRNRRQRQSRRNSSFW